MPQPIKLIIPDQWKSSAVAYDRYAMPKIASGSHTRTKDGKILLNLIVLLTAHIYILKAQ